MISEVDFCNGSPWQATFLSIAENLADKWQQSTKASISICQKAPKKLTTEAVFVMCSLFFFAMLSVIGSSINAYESFRKAFLVRKSPTKLESQKHVGKQEKQAENRTQSTEPASISVWRDNCRTFLDCFSIQSNARKILCDVSKKDHMHFIDGLRAVLFLLIFTIHFIYFNVRTLKNLHEHVNSLLKTPIVQYGVNVTFAVEAFFILSGFLNGHCFANSFKKNNGRVNWLGFYVFRFLRMTPPYLAFLGFYATLFPYMSSSPVWPTYDTNPVCKETWIWNLLYISNYNSLHNQCLTVSWFLACLMQLYVISPLFMVPLNRWPRFGYVLCGIAVCASCFIRFQISKQHNLFGSLPVQSNNLQEVNRRMSLYLDVLHQKMYTRITPYLIGILLGCYLQNRTLTKKNNWLTLCFGWISSALLVSISFFALHNREESVWESALYNSVKDLLFSCGFSWVIFVCATGQSAFIGKLLSLHIFKPLARISYCGFLAHAFVLEGYYLSVEVFLDESLLSDGMLSDLSWIRRSILLLLWTLPLSFAASVLFEIPVINLLQNLRHFKLKRH